MVAAQVAGCRCVLIFLFEAFETCNIFQEVTSTYVDSSAFGARSLELNDTTHSL